MLVSPFSDYTLWVHTKTRPQSDLLLNKTDTAVRRSFDAVSYSGKV